MNETKREHDAARAAKETTTGRVLHSAGVYDLLAWALLGSHERAFRQRVLDLGRVSPGGAILDVGCGTGTLALLAKERVGPAGVAHGVDASPEMIARARKKARRAGLDVAFDEAVIEALPFPAATFDTVISTLMLHHLPRALRAKGAREMHRVTRPGGRVVVVDFGGRTGGRSFLERFHRHGRLELAEMIRVLTGAGLTVEESGAMGVHDLQFVVARVP
jgi:ubiquinone/menaquinone biosynthesis C-methylase UbiE